MTTQIADAIKFAAGWNNAGSLALLVVQARGDPKKIYQGIQVGLPRTGGNGQRFNDGLNAVIPYNYLTVDEWFAQLGQFGLSSTVASIKATMSILNIYSGSYQNYNCWVGTPRVGSEVTHDVQMFRDIEFPLTRLIGPL